MSTSIAAANQFAKFPCVWCGTKLERRVEFAEEYEILCNVCADHCDHDSPYLNCSICLAKLWRVKLRAIWIFLRLMVVPGGAE